MAVRTEEEADDGYLTEVHLIRLIDESGGELFKLDFCQLVSFNSTKFGVHFSKNFYFKNLIILKT